MLSLLNVSDKNLHRHKVVTVDPDTIRFSDEHHIVVTITSTFSRMQLLSLNPDVLVTNKTCH